MDAFRALFPGSRKTSLRGNGADNTPLAAPVLASSSSSSGQVGSNPNGNNKQKAAADALKKFFPDLGALPPPKKKESKAKTSAAAKSVPEKVISAPKSKPAAPVSQQSKVDLDSLFASAARAGTPSPVPPGLALEKKAKSQSPAPAAEEERKTNLGIAEHVLGSTSSALGPDPAPVPITKYETTPLPWSNLRGTRIAVNQKFICYRKKEKVRVIHHPTLQKALVKGFKAPVVDMRFSETFPDLLAVCSSEVFALYRLGEPRHAEEKLAKVAEATLEADSSKFDRVAWSNQKSPSDKGHALVAVTQGSSVNLVSVTRSKDGAVVCSVTKDAVKLSPSVTVNDAAFAENVLALACSDNAVRIYECSAAASNVKIKILTTVNIRGASLPATVQFLGGNRKHLLVGSERNSCLQIYEWQPSFDFAADNTSAKPFSLAHTVRLNDAPGRRSVAGFRCTVVEVPAGMTILLLAKVKGTEMVAIEVQQLPRPKFTRIADVSLQSTVLSSTFVGSSPAKGVLYGIHPSIIAEHSCDWNVLFQPSMVLKSSPAAAAAPKTNGASSSPKLPGGGAKSSNKLLSPKELLHSSAPAPQKSKKMPARAPSSSLVPPSSFSSSSSAAEPSSEILQAKRTSKSKTKKSSAAKKPQSAAGLNTTEPATTGEPSSSSSGHGGRSAAAAVAASSSSSSLLRPVAPSASRSSSQSPSQASLGTVESALRSHMEGLMSQIRSENEKRSHSENKRMKKLLTAISTTLNEDVPDAIDEVVKSSLGGDAMTAAINAAVTSAMRSQGAAKDSADAIASHVQSSLQASLPAIFQSIAGGVSAQVVASLDARMQAMMQHGFQQALVPAFERGVNSMLMQFDAYFKGAVEQRLRAEAAARSDTERLVNEARALRASMEASAKAAETACMGVQNACAELRGMVSSGGIARTDRAPSEVSDTGHGELTIEDHIAEGNMEQAFFQALTKQDLGVVVDTCRMVDMRAILSMRPCPISQPILLSLLQQLSSELGDIEANPALRSERFIWLTCICTALNKNDPAIGDHIGGILMFAKEQLDAVSATCQQDNSYVTLSFIVNQLVM